MKRQLRTVAQRKKAEREEKEASEAATKPTAAARAKTRGGRIRSRTKTSNSLSTVLPICDANSLEQFIRGRGAPRLLRSRVLPYHAEGCPLRKLSPPHTWCARSRVATPSATTAVAETNDSKETEGADASALDVAHKINVV